MSENSVGVGEARSVACSQIVVEEGFNPREGLGDVEQLAASVARHGILQPLLARPGEDGSVVLIDGHRRLAAAQQAGLEQVPVLVRDDLDAQALVAALVTALKREDLNPVEEAKVYGRLLDGGLTKRGAAQAVGAAQKTVTARLQILQLPEGLHPAIAAGQLALSAVPALVAMAKVSPALAELVGRASPERVDSWAAERAVSQQQGEHGLWPVSGLDVQRLQLDPDQAKQADALSDEWSVWAPRFGEQELDRARAAGVLYTDNDDDYGYRSGVICDTTLATELTLECLQRDHQSRQRRLVEARRQAGKPDPGSPEAQQVKTEAKKVRERERELAVAARGANLDLGRKLLDQLAEVEVSKDLAQLLAYTVLSRPVEGYWTDQSAGGAYSVAALAGRGLRYVLPDWQQETQLKNGTTKVDYPGAGPSGEAREELEQRFWAWFEAAKTAEQIIGRLLISLAAAHWALDECLPRSRRLPCAIYAGKDDRAVKALERLTRKAVPASLKRARQQIADHA